MALKRRPILKSVASTEPAISRVAVINPMASGWFMEQDPPAAGATTAPEEMLVTTVSTMGLAD